jgi:hypothetical protein
LYFPKKPKYTIFYDYGHVEGSSFISRLDIWRGRPVSKKVGAC